MEHSDFKIQLSMCLDPKVFQERKEELMRIPRGHHKAFLEMIIYGNSVDRAKEECGKLAELSGLYCIDVVDIIDAMRRAEYGVNGITLKELDWSELN